MSEEKEHTNIFGFVSRPDKVHRVLAHSYFVYFFLFLFGVTSDIIFKVKIVKSAIMLPIGFTLLALASLLILWAQRTSRNLERGTISKESFCRGPYCYTRSPTHYGLFILMLGFGFIANAFFVIIVTIFAFLLTKVVFLRKEETILERKYGTPYLEYKKLVKH